MVDVRVMEQCLTRPKIVNVEYLTVIIDFMSRSIRLSLRKMTEVCSWTTQLSRRPHIVNREIKTAANHEMASAILHLIIQANQCKAVRRVRASGDRSTARGQHALKPCSLFWVS